MTLLPAHVPGIGKFWMDPERETITLVSRQLIDQMNGEWSDPVQCKIRVLDDGMAELTFRTVKPGQGLFAVRDVEECESSSVAPGSLFGF